VSTPDQLPTGEPSGGQHTAWLPWAAIAAAHRAGQPLAQIAVEFGVPRRVLTQAREARILTAYRAGATPRQIAAAEAMSRTGIYAALRRAGIDLGSPERRGKVRAGRKIPAAQIVAEFEAGTSIPQIAARHGVAASTAYRLLRRTGARAGLPKGDRADRDAEIIAAYRGGVSARDIAGRYGLHTTTIHHILRRHAVPRSQTPGRKPVAFDERTSAAELRVWLAWLGMDGAEAARVLGVRTDTVRRWLTDREPIPVRVGDELDAIEQATAAAVGQLIDALGDARDPEVVIYRTDADLWAAQPAAEPYPARWWTMVVARATAEVPGVEITYA